MSIQQCLEQAIERLSGRVHRVHSAGRTDAGVHARGMVCHLDSERDLPLSAWCQGVNRFLPADIAVRRAEFVDTEFHARFSATAKHYCYTLLCEPIRSPLERLISWQIKPPLRLEQMRRAAQDFVGRHDFAAFRTVGCAAETTVREIFAVDLTTTGHLVYVNVRGSGFLKQMVRMMVGTLVDIGRGKRPPEDVVKLLSGADDVRPALTAPAHGLCLMDVSYGDEIRSD